MHQLNAKIGSEIGRVNEPFSKVSSYRKILFFLPFVTKSVQTNGKIMYQNMVTMRGNQLPVSAAWWQHWSQICFAPFI
jgi:hypothetical protein